MLERIRSITFGSANTSRKANAKQRQTRLLRSEELEMRSLLSVSPVVAAFQDGVSANGAYVGTVDTKIDGSSATQNFGTSAEIAANGSRDVAALMKWDLSSIPAGSTVQSVSLVLNIAGTTKHQYELYGLKRNWSDGQANWTSAATGSNWEVAGAQGASDRGSAVLGTVTASTTGSHTFNLNAAGIAEVQSWINSPSSNYGMILQNYVNSDGVQFSSNEASTASARPQLVVSYLPPNKAPVVNAGADQSITLPSAAKLAGAVTDDGLPNGKVTTTWTKISGPGTVTFADAAAANTTANFSTAGSYVLRLTASDGSLSASDDIAINVTAAQTVNPVTASFQNGVSASGAYTGSMDTKIDGSSATQNFGTSAEIAANGSRDVAALMKWDLSNIPAGSTVQSVSLVLDIAGATKHQYELYGLKRNWSDGQANWTAAATGSNWEVAGAQGASDRGSTALGTVTASTTGSHAFNLNAAGIAQVQSWINSPSSNYGMILQNYVNTDGVQFSSNEASTASARPKLVVTYLPGTGGVTNKAPVVNAGADQSCTLPSTAKLDGTVTDDGLPSGKVTTTWTKVSGPGTVSFADAAAVDTTASFSMAGSYVLRLTASDGSLSTSDDIAITVGAQVVNKAPVVNAGADKAVTLPSTAPLDGTVTDDGLPNGKVTTTWTKVSGPGTVSFADATAVDTTASFSAAGSYVLRLTASDGSLSTSDDIAVTVGTQATNKAPVVNAGADKAVTLPSTASLDGTVTDDGLPNGKVTTTWTKVSGPGTVSFANAAAVDTTASFSTTGSYVLRLTASDGSLSASDDIAISVSSAPTTQGSGIWISREEIMALPTSGAAWDRLVKDAANNTTPDISDQNEDGDAYTLAKAIVGVRTGNATLMNQARSNLMAVIGTEDGAADSLGVSRNMASYVIAADIVGLSGTQDTQFRSWLRTMLTKNFGGKSIQTTHEIRPNNWGTMAGGSRMAIARYLGDTAELARAVQVFKGWLGDRSAYSNFNYGDDMSWQADPNRPVPVNPKGAMKNGYSIDGALPEEMRRGGSFKFPPAETNYAWGALNGAYVQAEILHRAGYDAYQWSDQAMLRTAKFLYETVGWSDSGDDQWIPYIIDARYGTHYADNPGATAGKILGYTAWTHQPGSSTGKSPEPMAAASPDAEMTMMAAASTFAIVDGTATEPMAKLEVASPASPAATVGNDAVQTKSVDLAISMLADESATDALSDSRSSGKREARGASARGLEMMEQHLDEQLLSRIAQRWNRSR